MPVIDSRTAVGAARQGLAKFNGDSRVAAALADGSPGTPMFVTGLDLASDYYLIPWLENGRVRLVVEIDAADGSLRSLAPVPQAGAYTLLSPEAALNILARRYPRNTFGKPRLVWAPCRESTSPLLPFYEIPSGGGILYVDFSGRVWPELTPLGRG
jgi:hypothetical protein